MKTKTAILCSAVLALTVMGCGAEIPDLTDEETEIISEYAAGVLMKYDKDNGSRLVDLAAVEESADMSEGGTEETQPQTEEVTDSEADTENAGDETAQVNDAMVVDNTDDAAKMPETLEGYYGIENFTFSYEGCELVSSYPEGTAEGEVYFAMNPTEGMRLLVMKFSARNQSGDEQTLNMRDYGVKLKVSVNGASDVYMLTTMLLNDIQNFEGQIASGEAAELVGVVEVPENTDVDSLTLIMKSGAGNSVLELQ